MRKERRWSQDQAWVGFTRRCRSRLLRDGSHDEGGLGVGIFSLSVFVFLGYHLVGRQARKGSCSLGRSEAMDLTKKPRRKFMRVGVVPPSSISSQRCPHIIHTYLLSQIYRPSTTPCLPTNNTRSRTTCTLSHRNHNTTPPRHDKFSGSASRLPSVRRLWPHLLPLPSSGKDID